MKMASYACNLNLIKVIMLCCDCCRSITWYATYRCYTVEHTCTTEAPQPPACYQCYMQPQIATISTLYEVQQHSIDATLPSITHNSAQLLTVVHPTSAAALQRLGCLNKSELGAMCPVTVSQTPGRCDRRAAAVGLIGMHGCGQL